MNIFRNRRSRKGTTSAARKEIDSPEDGKKKKSQRQRTSSNYSEIDLADDRPPPHAYGCHSFQGNGHCVKDTGRQLQQDGETVFGQHEVSPLKAVDTNENMGRSEDQMRLDKPEGKAVYINENTGQSEDQIAVDTPEWKNVYFILEPQPEVVTKRGVLFLTDTQGRDLCQSGQEGRGSSEELGPSDVHHVDDNAGDKPYYSEIKEVDESFGMFSWHSYEPQLGQSDHKGTERPVSYGEYENVDLESDEGSNTGPKLKLRSETSQEQLLNGTANKSKLTSPSSVVFSSAERLGADDDELIMVDNVAYESADDVLGDIGQTSIQTDDNNEESADVDDEPIMIDNVAYESSASLQHIDSCQAGRGLQQAQWSASNNNYDGDDSDEVIMIDNVAYQSSASLQHTDRHVSGPFPQLAQRNATNVDDDDDEHYELIMIDNVAYQSSPSLQHIDSSHPGSGLERAQKDATNTDDDNEYNDDEDVMIDNVAYESADSLGLNSSGESGLCRTEPEPSRHRLDQNRRASEDHNDAKGEDSAGEYVTINDSCKSSSAPGLHEIRQQRNENEHADKREAGWTDDNDKDDDCVMTNNDVCESTSGLYLDEIHGLGNDGVHLEPIKVKTGDTEENIYALPDSDRGASDV